MKYPSPEIDKEAQRTISFSRKIKTIALKKKELTDIVVVGEKNEE